MVNQMHILFHFPPSTEVLFFINRHAKATSGVASRTAVNCPRIQAVEKIYTCFSIIRSHVTKQIFYGEYIFFCEFSEVVIFILNFSSLLSGVNGARLVGGD